MLDQPSNDAGKSTPGWALFENCLGMASHPAPGRATGKTGSRTPKEPEERKHQFATWYIFCGLPRRDAWSSSCGLRFTQIETIPYSRFEQLLDENKIAEVLVGQETIQGTLKEPFPDGRKGFYTVRVEPGLADKLRAHGVVITGAPSSTFLSTILSWVLPIFIFYLIWSYGFRRMAERPGSRRPDVDRQVARQGSMLRPTRRSLSRTWPASDEGENSSCRKSSPSCAIRHRSDGSARASRRVFYSSALQAPARRSWRAQ